MNNMNNKENKELTFHFGDKLVKPDPDQSQVIVAPFDKNILVIACAGSGKTTTVLCRIKYLLDKGVDPSSIILTTFTRDATTDMTERLETIIGYDNVNKLTVGTLDAISLRIIRIYAGDEIASNGIYNVGEYGFKFYDFLCDREKSAHFLKRINYLIVDEYQDINEIQAKIIEEFYKNKINILTVGDDAQNIYSFRGSDVNYILNFENRFKNTMKIMLRNNYRSVPEIVNYANSSIQNNKFQIPKQMIPKCKSIFNDSKNTLYGLPTINFYKSSRIEHINILKKINEYNLVKKIPKHEIAIISRNRHSLKEIESYLSSLSIDTVLSESENGNSTKARPNHIFLTTIHGSKGLEWDVVFLIGCNDNFFPNKKSPIAIEEDRRLFYVATTRPKKYLHISFTPASGYPLPIAATRYLLEVEPKFYNFNNYDNDFNMLSQESNNQKFSSCITGLIRNLDGEDYKYLKENKIIPRKLFKSPETFMKLYPPNDYKEFIIDYDMYSDFGIFIDDLVCRQIGELNPHSGGLIEHCANKVIASLILVDVYYKKYLTYRDNFEINGYLLTNLLKKELKINKDHSLFEQVSHLGLKLDTLVQAIYRITSSDIKKVLENIKDIGSLSLYVKLIAINDMDVILNIVRLILKQSIIHHIEPHQIHIISVSYIPKDFKPKMEQSYVKFKNSKLNYNDIITDIYEVSKCKNILSGRTRLLYKPIGKIQLDEYNHMYNGIWETFSKPICEGKLLNSVKNSVNEDPVNENPVNEDPVNEICKKKSPTISAKPFFNYNGVEGEADLIVDDTIIDFKNSGSHSIQPEWLLQLLGYTFLARQNGYIINNIAIFNTLGGLLYKMDVSKWRKGLLLIRYLLNVRDKKIEREFQELGYKKMEKLDYYKKPLSAIKTEKYDLINGLKITPDMYDIFIE